MNEVSRPTDPVFAQMVHQSHLLTWLVRLVGKALAILVLVPVVCFVISVFLGVPGFGLWAGTVVAVVWLLILLCRAHAPLPSDTVMSLLED